jgi:hypothetical protein
MSSRAEMIRLMDKAITALRQAIAEAEKQEPWVKTYCGGKPNYTTPEQEPVVYQCPKCKHVHAIDMSQERVDETAKHGHEPVAWREVVGKTTKYYDYNEEGRGEPLYAAPQPDLARVGEVGIWGEEIKE